MKVKLADYVAQKVVELGARHVFMVTGGGAMHLNYALGTHPGLSSVFNHHEQACAMGAEAYYRLSNRLAVVNVTSGPGGTNAITGVYGAWTDSIGMIVLSGQVKYETTVRSTGMALRQYGDQELDIEELVRPITKYCAMVIDPLTIRFHLEKAFHLAVTGRPGPCWLDIPLNVQGAQIEVDDLPGFNPGELTQSWKGGGLQQASASIFDRISSAKRPVIFAGGGVRLSGKHDDFIRLVDKLGIPVVTGWNAHDAIWNAHPCYVGRPGTVGDRAGNFAAQNADLLLILGSRLNIRQISYSWSSFSRASYKIWVDVDELEMQKPTVKADMRIHADLADLLPVLADQPYASSGDQHRDWLNWCLERRQKYPIVLSEYWESSKVNPYCFIDKLFEQLAQGQIVVSANGTACVTSFQAAVLKEGQRLWTNSGCAAMGYDLPAAIGACLASGNQSIVCLAGDGSIMMNLQELQTIVGNSLPIKIFLLNNLGYSSIYQSQRNFFKGQEVGASPSSGVNFPSFERLSFAFGLPYWRCCDHQQLDSVIRDVLATAGPVVCEVMLDENQQFSPKLASRQLPDGTIVSPPLEDLAPFLSREELQANMLIDS